MTSNHNFTKFNIRKFYKSLSTYSNFGLNLEKERPHPASFRTIAMSQVSKSAVPVSRKIQFGMPNDNFDNAYKHLNNHTRLEHVQELDSHQPGINRKKEERDGKM
jgi:hypothetical protein